MIFSIAAPPSTRPSPPDPFADRYHAYQKLVRDAQAALEKKDYPAGIDLFTRAIEISPFVPAHYYHRGLAGYRLGEHAKAIGDFDKALILDARLASAYLYRGLCRLKRGEYRQALADYNAALGINPDDATTHNNLAWLYASAEDERFRDGVKALEHASKAARLSKERNAEILDTLARSCFINGKLNEAVDAERKALRLDPENGTFKANLRSYEQAVSDHKPTLSNQ